MIKTIITYGLLISALNMSAQETEKLNVSSIEVSHILNKAENNSGLNESKVIVSTNKDWGVSASKYSFEEQNVLGVGINKTVNLKSFNLTTNLSLNNSDFLASNIFNINAEKKIKDSLVFIGGSGIYIFNEQANTLTQNLGVIKTNQSHSLIGRVFNGSNNQTYFNPSASFAWLKESEKSLIQLNVQGGFQNILVINNNQNNFQKQMGLGIWYRSQLGKNTSLSMTSSYSKTLRTSAQPSLGTLFLNTTLKYNFNYGK